MPTWLWVKANGTILKVFGAPPILEPILVVGLNRMFTGFGLTDLDFDPWPHTQSALRPPPRLRRPGGAEGQLGGERHLCGLHVPRHQRLLGPSVEIRVPVFVFSSLFA